MKRRILAIVLASALVLSLAACGGKDDGASSNPGGGSSNQVDNSAPDKPAAPDGPAIPAGSQPEVSLPDDSGADASEPASDASVSDPAGADIKLTLNRTSIELNKAGATFKLRYTVDPDIYDGLAVFASSDTKVATVDEIDGTIKAVAPGKATITVKYDSATATASVNCNWSEEPSQPETSDPADSTPGAPSIVPDGDPTAPDGDPSTPGDEPAAPDGDPSESTDDPSAPADDSPAFANVDLSAFYSTITDKYAFAMLELADDGILDMFYEGMTGISTEQRLIYICGMSMNTGEFGLVQVKDSKDVDAVKAILQARIDAQAGGGAWYPMAVENWKNNSRVVSNGNYVMMVVHESCDDIVKAFNALF